MLLIGRMTVPCFMKRVSNCVQLLTNMDTISGEAKKKLCLSLGATSFLDYKTDDIEAEVKSLTSDLGAHAVICLANNEKAYAQSMRMLRRTGILVCVGIPNIPFNLPATPLDMIVKGMDLTLLVP